MTTVSTPIGEDLRADLQEARDRKQRYCALRSFATFLPHWQFKDRETGEVRSFNEETLWEGQREFRDAADEYEWLLGLKAGKLGWTELECAFDVYRLLSCVNSRVHVFSRDATAAEKLLEYIRFGLTHLPDWMRIELLADERGGDTGHSLKVRLREDDIRTVERYAAGKHVSIDASCQHAHVDEFGAMPFQKETWGAISSTIAPDGTCHVVSRGYGEDVYLKGLWDAAVDGGSRLHPLFCDWTKRLGRDEAWRRQAEADNPHGIRFFAPEKPEDCLSGEDTQNFVPIDWWDNCKGVLPPFTPQSLGKTPVVLGCDAAGGRTGTGDTFAIVATTRHPQMHEEGVAIWMSRYWEPPFEFTLIEEAIKEFCRDFNVVEIVYDPYQLEAMMERINRDIGVWCTPFDQTKKRNIADRFFYDLIAQQRLIHTGQEDLRQHIANANAKVERDQDSKIRMVKKAPHRKIDLAVAASMACYECLDLLL